MATEKPRFTITMDESLLEKIDDYKFESRIKNQSKAIVELVRIGLDRLEEQDAEQIKKAASRTEAAKKADVDSFKKVLDRAGLLNSDGDLSDSDLEFLSAMFVAIKAHFKDR